MASQDTFKQDIINCKNLVVFTGAGVSAESGIPVLKEYRWKCFSYYDMANKREFQVFPSRVWQFYQHRKDTIGSKEPNAAHMALAALEKVFVSKGKQFTIVTCNHDSLHQKAGSNNVIEIHGNIFTAKCTECGEVTNFHDKAFSPSLHGKGGVDSPIVNLHPDQLPKCERDGSPLRPNVIWPEEDVMHGKEAEAISQAGDFAIVVGLSSKVTPISNWPVEMAKRDIGVAEFTLKKSEKSSQYRYVFEGKCAETLPAALQGII